MQKDFSKELGKFYKTLGGKGAEALEPDDPYYVPILQNNPSKDPILKLRQRIEWSESESVDLLTGFRGNGKSTELKRLRRLLERNDCTVFLVDMNDYLLLTKPVEVSDFILSIMAALTVEVEKNEGLREISESYWNRFLNFLESEVQLKDISLQVKSGGVAAKLGLQLKTEPTFKQKLQKALRGHLTTLVEDARDYVVKIVEEIRTLAKNPDKKVVLLVDSVEQIRGSGDEAESVHKSIVELFSGHSKNLEFRMLHIVYTIPPFLIPLAPNTGRSLGGHPINSWPNIHVKKREDASPDKSGLEVMEKIINKRYPDWQNMFSKEQLFRLAASSGGDLRDFFRLVRECLVSKSTSLKGEGQEDMKISDLTLSEVEGQLKSELLPIAKDDGIWLAKIHATKDTQLDSNEELPRLARFLDHNLIMNYLNGEPWYDIHPLLEKEIRKYKVT